jgi:hypothetical protein
MSAIAFYDSGRLLPLRHELKQKQIEQRNIDAENTRKYIGYAGGSFANMAEKTGTIFGGRLGSAPAVDDKGEAIAKYGGGTTGAEYAKADWQKGMMDNEDHRRTVTHKLGLLTENVKYSTLRRHHEAWGGIDDKAAKEQFDKRWEQYHLDVKDGTMNKAELIQKYHDFFEPDVSNLVKEYNAKDKEGNFIVADEDTRAELLEGLNQFSPYSRWLKYAEENDLYDPTVAGKARPEVDLLMAFLKDEVKFPGINEMLANRDDTKQQQKLSALQQEQQKNPNVTLLEQLLEKRKEATTTDSSNNEVSMEDENETFTLENIANTASKVAEKLSPSYLWKASEKAGPKKIVKGGSKYTGFSYSGSASDVVKDKENLKSYLQEQLQGKPAPIDFTTLPDTNKKNLEVVKKLARRDITETIKNLPTIGADGKPLTIFDQVRHGTGRIIAVAEHKIANGIPLLIDPTDPYKDTPSGPKVNSKKVLLEEITKMQNTAIARNRIEGTDGGEINMLENKIKGLFQPVKAFIETHITGEASSNVGGLEHIEAMANRSMQKELNALNRDSINVEPNITQASMIGPSSPTLETDPADLSPEQQYDQAIKHVIDHEDPDLSGRIIDDNNRAILGGSVDAWDIAREKFFDKDGNVQWQTNYKLNRHIISNVLKITDPTKMRAFVNYFNAKDLDEHLGHKKKGKPALTDLQLKRRRLLRLTSDQTKALVRWAYDNNLKTLTKSHGFLDKEVYLSNPSLHQLLGDMAYRHGGSFMVKEGAGYIGLADAIKHALYPTEDYSRATAIAKMDRLLFGQGTYGKKNKKVSNRYHFLKDRFKRFKKNVTGVNVAKKKIIPNTYFGSGYNITLADNKPVVKMTHEERLAQQMKDANYKIQPLRKYNPVLSYK